MSLNDFQLEILEEMKSRRFGGGLSLPMGSGKTFISLSFCINKTSLFVMSKTLVSVWIQEIEKFFPNEPYYVLTTTDKPIPNVKWILTTPDTLVSWFKKENVESLFCEMDRSIKHYMPVTSPYSLNQACIYAKTFDVMIIDEIQQYTNIETSRCLAICTIYTKCRWGLSGTMFTEPNVKRLLGYYLMLNIKDFPRNLPGCITRVQHPNFKGVKQTIVSRDSNEAFI